MKRALAVVLAVAFVGLMAAGATAQVPFCQVYFDADYNETQAFCRPPGTFADLYVAFLNWNMFVGAVDYSIDFPPAVFFAGETTNTGVNDLVIGSSNSDGGGGPGSGGIAIAWNLPQNGFQPLLASTVHVIWTGACNCVPGGTQAIVVKGYHYAEVGGKAQPSGVRWPDYAELDAVGMTSLICPEGVGTEETTWGGIKALYR
jgi:hypothetical protein